MNRYFRKKTTAVLCLLAILCTVSLAGCGKAENGSQTSDIIQSQTASVTGESPSAAPDVSSEGSAAGGKTSSADSLAGTSDESAAESSQDSTVSAAESSRTSVSSSVSETAVSERSEAVSSAVSDMPSHLADTSVTDQSESSSQESTAPPKTADDFTYTTGADGQITLTGYSGHDTEVMIPSTINGQSVTHIGNGCFQGSATLCKAVIPESVTAIGDYAFECCYRLESLVLPDALKQIGEGAFSGCHKLSDMVLPDGVEVIEKGAFLYCRALPQAALPSALRELGHFAFANCSGMTAVTFRGTQLKTLPDRAFYGCSKLTEVNVPYAVDTIGKRAFAACKALERVSFAGQVQSVGDYAFQRCDSLAQVSLQAVSLADTAYRGCYLLPEEMRHEIPDRTIYTTPADQGGDSSEMSRPAVLGSIAGDRSLFDESKYGGYRTISNEAYDEWSQKYLTFCESNGVPTDRDAMLYTMLYKGEVIPHFMGMTAAQNHDPSMTADAVNAFGDDFEEMYLMMDHGLFTELHRGKMCDDLVLYSGVYDSQLQAAAGTQAVPTLEQLRDAIGNTFTDPIMISTTTDIEVACNFSQTLFIIYASRSSMDALGALSIDSFVRTNEKEILMANNAVYRLLDVGTMAVDKADGTTLYRNYVKVELL